MFMEKSSLAVIIAAVVIVAAVGGFVILNQNDGGDDGPETVTDVRGRVVTLPEQVDKIVCLQAGAVRLAAYLDAGDMIVGVDSFDAKASGPKPFFNHATYRLAVDTSRAVPMETETVVQDGTMYNIGGPENYKAIQKTGADLILCSEPEKAKLDTIQLQTGIPVVGIAADGDITVQDQAFKDNLRIAGKALNKEARAEALIEGADKILNDLKEKAGRIAAADMPLCYVGGMLYMMQGGLYMTTGNYLSFDLAGAKNVMPDTNHGDPYMTQVKVVAASNAQYIFVDSIKCGASQEEYVADQSTLSALPAVEDGNIYSLYSYKFYGTNWESELMNAYYIGHVLHPEVYGNDAECKAQINSILELFYPDSAIDANYLAYKQSPGAGELNW